MLIALDTETCLIEEFVKTPPLVCVSFAGEDGSRGLLRWCDAKQKVAEILTHHTMVGAHIAYDMAIFANTWPDLQPLIWQAYAEDRIRDVQLEAKLDDIRDAESTKKSYSLAALVKKFYGVDMDKNTWRLRYGEFRDLPLELWPEGARQYPMGDVEYPLRMVLEGKVNGGPDKFRQARHGWWCDLMGIWGIQTDPARVAKLKASLLMRQDEALKVLVDAGVIRSNGTQDTKRTRALMLEACEREGLRPRFSDPSGRFPEGQVSIDAEACRDSRDPVLEVMASYGSIRKQLSSDIPNLERGEIHTKYDSLKDNGRVGSGGDDSTSPTGKASNLTNLPRSGGIRECFVPRPGKVFFDSDYDGLEARTGAQACLWLIGESVLAGILNRDEDWHIHTASGFFEAPYDETLTRYKQGDAEVRDIRQFSKIVNYGCGGGMGTEATYAHTLKELKKEPATRALAYKLKREQSDKLWYTWRTKYPEWQKYFNRTAAMVRGGGCQFTQFVSGRVRGVTGKSAYTEMNNGWFSGLGADAAKDAGWQTARECYDVTRNSVLFGSRLVIFGHDSLTGETDPEGAHECAQRLKELMEGVSPTWCPDVPLTTTPCLTTCLSKAAKAVYDQNKRLLPWSPPV